MTAKVFWLSFSHDIVPFFIYFLICIDPLCPLILCSLKMFKQWLVKMNSQKKKLSVFVYICKGENTIGNWEYANRGKETISQLCRLIFVENSFVVMIRRKKKVHFYKRGRKDERGGGGYCFRTDQMEIILITIFIGECKNWNLHWALTHVQRRGRRREEKYIKEFGLKSREVL